MIKELLSTDLENKKNHCKELDFNGKYRNVNDSTFVYEMNLTIGRVLK